MQRRQSRRGVAGEAGAGAVRWGGRERGAARGRRSGWLPRGRTAAPASCCFVPFILGDELANADVFLAYRPGHAWLAEGLRGGGIPFWNPYLLGGFPLAFTEYGWFSPLNWAPLLLLGPHTGFYLAVAPLRDPQRAGHVGPGLAVGRRAG